MSAPELNSRFESLLETFDKFYASIPTGPRETINRAVTDWQDFYFGYLDEWPAAKLADWEIIHAKTADTLKASIPSGAKAEAIPVAAKQAAKSSTNTVFFVGGQNNSGDILPWDLALPKWWLLALPAIPAVWYLLRRIR